MYEDGELLSHHRSEPHVRFARAPRHGLKDPAGGGAGTAASGPGPARAAKSKAERSSGGAYTERALSRAPSPACCGTLCRDFWD
eukprot:1258339-Rhodomonas_salina.2